jgi:hypothetical protein
MKNTFLWLLIMLPLLLSAATAQSVSPSAAARLYRQAHEHEIFAEFNDLVAIPNIASDAALSIPDVLQIPMAVAIFAHLGYPTYLLPFIGIAKILGVVAVLVPGFPRLKEWAYAGLVFDLTGALYSHISVGDSPCQFSISGYRVAFSDWVISTLSKEIDLS